MLLRKAQQCSVNLWKHGQGVLKTINNEHFSTLAGVTRRQHEKKVGLQKQKQTYDQNGIPYHNPNDESGHPHSQVIDLDSIDQNGDVLVYCTFTTKDYPLNGKKPEIIANITFTKQQKIQYGHIYNPPRKINLRHLKFSPECHAEMANNPKYLEFFRKINNLGPEINIADKVVIEGILNHAK